MSLIQTLKDKFLAASVAVADFKNNEKGVTAVEYAVVIAGITVIVLFIFGKDGPVKEMLTNVFGTVKTRVTTAVETSLAS